MAKRDVVIREGETVLVCNHFGEKGMRFHCYEGIPDYRILLICDACVDDPEAEATAGQLLSDMELRHVYATGDA